MNRTEVERLAVVETDVKHIAEAVGKLTDAVTGLQSTVAGWDNQFKGGRTVLAALFSLAAAVGGFLVWLWQHIPWK